MEVIACLESAGLGARPPRAAMYARAPAAAIKRGEARAHPNRGVGGPLALLRPRYERLQAVHLPSQVERAARTNMTLTAPQKTLPQGRASTSDETRGQVRAGRTSESSRQDRSLQGGNRGGGPGDGQPRCFSFRKSKKPWRRETLGGTDGRSAGEPSHAPPSRGLYMVAWRATSGAQGWTALAPNGPRVSGR